MQKYQSHKIVEAARIRKMEAQPAERRYAFELEQGDPHYVDQETGSRLAGMALDNGVEITTGWLVKYEDGYLSWSPNRAFTEGYDLVQPSSGKSNIKGYRELSEGEINAINTIKDAGRDLEALIHNLKEDMNADSRWIAIGKTHLQQGLMALTRSIAKPDFF